MDQVVSIEIKSPRIERYRDFGVSGRKEHFRGLLYHHLFMEPKGIFRKHGEIFIAKLLDIDTWKVMSDVDHPLTHPLCVSYRPGVNQFTRAL